MSISNSQPNVSNLRPYFSNPPAVTDGIFCFDFSGTNGVSRGIHAALKEENFFKTFETKANELTPEDLAIVFSKNVNCLAVINLKNLSSYPNYLKVLQVFKTALNPYFDLVESTDERGDLLEPDIYKMSHNQIAAKCQFLENKELAQIFSSHGLEKKSSSSSTEKKI